MDSPVAYLTHLRQELATFEARLGEDLDVPIEHCGSWTLYDLADHVGRGNLWAAVAVTEQRGDHDAATAPRAPADLARWFAATSASLLSALDAPPSTSAWTFFPPRTVGFWQRRRYLETLVHRWDAEHALGIDSDIDPLLAADGVAEVLDTMAPRQFALGRATSPERAVRFTATDTASSWVLGPGDPVATISATAADLLLMLWRRRASDDPSITWDGDREAGLIVLDRPLVP
jgi:uncharacterized protein (TIGR03083 family)